MKTPLLGAIVLLLLYLPLQMWSQTPATPDLIYAIGLESEGTTSTLGTLDPSTGVFSAIGTISDPSSETEIQATGISIDDNGIIYVIANAFDEVSTYSIYTLDALSAEASLVVDLTCLQPSTFLGSLAFAASGDLLSLPLLFGVELFDLNLIDTMCTERLAFDEELFNNFNVFAGLERNLRNDSIYTVRTQFALFGDVENDLNNMQELKESMQLMLPEGTPLDLFRYDAATNTIDSVFRFEVGQAFQFFTDVVFDSEENFYAFSLGFEGGGGQIYSLDMENGIMVGSVPILGIEGVIAASLAPPDDNDPGAAVPTLSQWGLIILFLFMVIFSVLVFRQSALVPHKK